MAEPGSGPVTSTYFEIDHRLGVSGAWTTVSIPAANGGGKIEGYAQGKTIQLRLRGLSGAGVPSAWTSPVTLVIGAGDAAIPAALDDEAINITTLLGSALIQLSTGSDPATTKVRVYRSTSPMLNRETDAVGEPSAVGPMQSYSIALGDTTRSNLLTDGGFDNPAAWTHGAGWALADSEATHTPGTADDIGQAFATQVGKFYRISFDTSGVTAGTVTPWLIGGSDRPGTPASTSGLQVQRIQAVSGNASNTFRATSAFDGTLDGAVAYLETEASLSQPYSHAPQWLGHDLEEPKPWAWDGGKRREQVLDHNIRPPRVVRKIGWLRCLRCQTSYFSPDVVRQRMCDRCKGETALKPLGL